MEISRTDLTRIGIYIVIVLTTIKFVILPLNDKIKEKREILSELTYSYSLKNEIYQKKLFEVESSRKAPDVSDYVYAKKHSYNTIRNTVLHWLMDEAEKKGLSVVSFELPEIKKGKTISEINVVLRLRGKIKSLYDYFDVIEQTDKILLIRTLEINKLGQDFNFSIGVAFFRGET